MQELWYLMSADGAVIALWVLLMGNVEQKTIYVLVEILWIYPTHHQIIFGIVQALIMAKMPHVAKQLVRQDHLDRQDLEGLEGHLDQAEHNQLCFI